MGISRFAVALAVSLVTGGFAADPPDPVAVYKTGDYKAAIPLLQVSVRTDPKNPTIAAALLSSLVYEGRVDEAADLSDADAIAFANDPEVIAARGEFAYYMSDMGTAERLFDEAIKLKESTSRALFGKYRLFRLASMYRSARILCLRAHEVDPDDARITVDWLRYLVPAKRAEVMPEFVAQHPWFYKYAQPLEDTDTALEKQLNGQKAYQLADGRKETTLTLVALLDNPRYARGVGLEVTIEGGRRFLTLFDTGSSGILLRQAAVDKAGLVHTGSFQMGGIGDKGLRNSFASVAQDCTVGTLEFHTCIFDVLEGKGRVAEEDDGLIGADLFADYIIHVDFQKRQLHLVPQPDRPANPQGYDRVIPSDATGFTRVFRQGGHLFVLTKVNGITSGLFLLDTGAFNSVVDATFARLSTKIHGDDWMRVRGVDGEVKSVFEADRAELQFARFQQKNLGLVSFNINNSPYHQDFRMAGILGIPILSMFRLTLDYRNGLVDFDYIFEKRH